MVMVQLTEGLVNITDMSNFYFHHDGERNFEPEYSVQQSAAHFYGESKNLFSISRRIISVIS